MEKMLKRIFTVFCVIVLLTISSCDKTNEGGKWVDYGNGMVNLDQVSRLDWGTQATYENSAGVDTTQTCKTVIEEYDKLKWTEIQRATKNIKCVPYVKFDLFTLTLLGEKTIIGETEHKAVKDSLEVDVGKIREFMKNSDKYLRF